MKKTAKILTTALVAAAMLASSASAAVGDIKVKTGGVTKAPIQDGKITAAEYGNCSTLVFDGSGKNTEGTWANTSWATQKFTVYSAWDAKNLYLGITIEGDTTNNQVTKDSLKDGCPFGQCDSFQLGFNPGNIIKDQNTLLFCIGLNEGECYVEADAYRSETDGEQNVKNYTKLKTYCTKYSDSGINYSFEVAIPWTEICVKGAGRSGEGAKVFDMTGELAKIKAGYELPFFFVYTDKDANGQNIYIRSDATTGASWKAQEMGSIVFQLQAAPAASNPGSAAQTADTAALVLLAMTASAGAAFALKKRKK